MTICFKNSGETAKFFAKVLFQKTCMKDYAICNFKRIEYLSGFESVSVETDKSVSDVENLLTKSNVKFNWVTPF